MDVYRLFDGEEDRSSVWHELNEDDKAECLTVYTHEFLRELNQHGLKVSELEEKEVKKVRDVLQSKEVMTGIRTAFIMGIHSKGVVPVFESSLFLNLSIDVCYLFIHFVCLLYIVLDRFETDHISVLSADSIRPRVSVPHSLHGVSSPPLPHPSLLSNQDPSLLHRPSLGRSRSPLAHSPAPLSASLVHVPHQEPHTQFVLGPLDAAL